MSVKIQCPCITYERPMCGAAACWHHASGAAHDCALCHRTGRVQAGTVAKLLRHLRPSQESADVSTPRRPEALAQSRITRLYRTVGCAVYSTSAPRATRSTPGIPDLLVFHPRSGRHWAHEVKPAGGRLSDNQVIFQRTAQASGLTVVVGDETAARAHLVALGLVRDA